MTQYNLYVSKGKKWKVKIIWTKAVSPASHPNTQHTHKKKDRFYGAYDPNGVKWGNGMHSLVSNEYPTSLVTLISWGNGLLRCVDWIWMEQFFC